MASVVAISQSVPVVGVQIGVLGSNFGHKKNVVCCDASSALAREP